ncbi:tetratricopeptide repeat protein [bacterium]|nr:tetratricopeptide repeat protein [bacterium]
MKMTHFSRNKPLSCILLFLFWQALCQQSLWAFQKDLQKARADLEKGIALYRSADFEAAAKLLADAIRASLPTREDLVNAHKYLAFVYAILDDKENARLEFTKVLELDPAFELPESESPRLREPFLLARSGLPRDSSPPVIICECPDRAIPGTPFPVSARITDDSGVDRAVLWYRSGDETAFTPYAMIRKDGDNFQAVIPKEQTTAGPGFLYIEAADVKGNGPAFWRSRENPFQVVFESAAQESVAVTDQAVPPGESTSIGKKKSKKWLYIGIGAAVVGGGLLGVALMPGSEPGPEPAGSILPDPPADPQ